MTNTTKTATVVRTLNERQILCRLSQPVQWGWGEEKGETSYVVSSKANAFGQPGMEMLLGGYASEILVFPAEESGSIIEMIEIGGSYSEESHSSALEGMGFRLLEEPEQPTRSELATRALEGLTAELEAIIAEHEELEAEIVALAERQAVLERRKARIRRAIRFGRENS
jgi:hypothetical protein